MGQTQQETFNKVVAFARKQNKRCQELDGSCRYRGSNGERCFVGALIPDDLYSSDMEGATAKDIIADYKGVGVALLPSDIDREDGIDFFTSMQAIHDQSSASEWEDHFVEFAARNNLTMPEMTPCSG